jgi:hypothetical protein
VDVTVEAVVGKLARELRRLKDELEAVRVTVVEDRPDGETFVVDRIGNAVEELAGWSAEAVAAAEKTREAVVGERVKLRLVGKSLGESQRSFHRVLPRYNELVSYERMAELVELGRRGEWAAWVTGVRKGWRSAGSRWRRLRRRTWSVGRRLRGGERDRSQDERRKEKNRVKQEPTLSARTAKGRPPSMKASALSRDTCSVRAAGSFFSYFEEAFSFLHFDQGSLLESCGGIWFHQPSIRSRTSDHDSFFRLRDHSRRQDAQSKSR